MAKGKFLGIVGLIGVAFLVLPIFTLADDYDPNVSKFSISLDFMVGSDSNIVETNEEMDDSFYSILPKLVFSRTGESSFFYIGYGLRYDSYVDQTDFDNTSHNLDLLARFNFSDSLTLVISDKFVDSVYGLWRAETDTITGDGYMLNTISPSVTYESTSGSFTLDVGLHNTFEKWHEADFQDWTQNIVSVKAGFAVGPQTKIGIVGDYLVREFDDLDADWDGYFAGVMLKYSVPDMVDVDVLVGQEMREYTDVDEDASEVSYEISLSKIFTEVTSVRFTLGSKYVDSEVYLGDFYTSFGGSLDYSYIFNEKIQLFLKTQYLENTYEFTDREDELLRFYGGVGYKFIDWLAVQAFYNFSTRTSNIDAYDIDDSRIELHLNFFKDFVL